MHTGREGMSAMPYFDDFDLSTVDILLISQYVIPSRLSALFVWLQKASCQLVSHNASVQGHCGPVSTQMLLQIHGPQDQHILDQVNTNSVVTSIL